MSTVKTPLELATQMLKRDLGEEICAYLKDEDVIEIMLNPDGRVWLDTHSLGMRDANHYIDSGQAVSILRTVAGILDVEVDGRVNQLLSGELSILNGERFQGWYPPVVRNPCFNIRKLPSRVYKMEDYIEEGTLSLEQCNLIREALKARQNILLVGGSGSGKTTFCNALLEELSHLTPEHRIYIVEDTRELICDAPCVIQTRSNEDVSGLELLKASLRARPDRIIFGEVRDVAAQVLAKAWNTGHPGGLCTIHGNSGVEGLERFATLCEESGVRPSCGFLKAALEVVIYMERLEGKRYVKEFLEVRDVKLVNNQLEFVTEQIF